MEPFKFRSCGVGIVIITESNSEKFSFRSVTCHVLAIRESFPGFSSVLIVQQCVSYRTLASEKQAKKNSLYSENTGNFCWCHETVNCRITSIKIRSADKHLSS